MKVRVENLEKALMLFENIIDMHHLAGNSDSPYSANDIFNYDYKTAEAGVSLMKGILMGLLDENEEDGLAKWKREKAIPVTKIN